MRFLWSDLLWLLLSVPLLVDQRRNAGRRPQRGGRNRIAHPGPRGTASRTSCLPDKVHARPIRKKKTISNRVMSNHTPETGIRANLPRLATRGANNVDEAAGPSTAVKRHTRCPVVGAARCRLGCRFGAGCRAAPRPRRGAAFGRRLKGPLVFLGGASLVRVRVGLSLDSEPRPPIDPGTDRTRRAAHGGEQDVAGTRRKGRSRDGWPRRGARQQFRPEPAAGKGTAAGKATVPKDGAKRPPRKFNPGASGKSGKVW